MRTSTMPTDQQVDCDKVSGVCPVFRMEALRQIIGRFGGSCDAEHFTYG